jgi:hypothetical protein
VPTPDSISGDIISAGTFLAGLILVYLGNLATGYGSYTADQQSAVRVKFRRKAAAAFWGVVISIISVAFALASAWFDCAYFLLASVGLLAIIFVCGIVFAFLTFQEIT